MLPRRYLEAARYTQTPFGRYLVHEADPRDRCSEDVASEVDELAKQIAAKITKLGHTGENYDTVKASFARVETSLNNIKSYVSRRKEEVDALFSNVRETVKCPKRGCECVFHKEGGASFDCSACKRRGQEVFTYCMRHVYTYHACKCNRNIICKDCVNSLTECVGVYGDGDCEERLCWDCVEKSIKEQKYQQGYNSDENRAAKKARKAAKNKQESSGESSGDDSSDDDDSSTSRFEPKCGACLMNED